MSVSLLNYFLCSLVEVLLDMNAAGGELGWLTSPYEDGVSIYTSADISNTSNDNGPGRLKMSFTFSQTRGTKLE
jgi:hypothetical protein